MSGWWILAAVMVLALALVGWPLCAMAARHDQQDEDEYGVDKARRS